MMAVTILDILSPSHQEVYDRIQKGESTPPVLRLNTRYGKRYLDSPYDPVKEARMACRSLDPSIPAVLMGAGSGYFLDFLLDEYFQQILLVTGSRHIGELNQNIAENHERDDVDVTIIISTDAERAWNEGVIPFIRQFESYQVVHHPRERTAFPGLIFPLCLRLEISEKTKAKDELFRKDFSVQENTGVKNANGTARQEKNVLVPASKGMLEPEVMDEFRKRGFRVYEVPALGMKKLPPQSVCNLLDMYKPDLVFSTENQGSDIHALVPEACELNGIPWVTWMLDDPRFVLDAQETDGQAPNRIGFMWDNNGFDAWNEMGLTHSTLLPLATNPEKFFPGKGDPTLSNRIVFVGTPFFVRAEKFFASYKDDKGAIALAERVFEEMSQRRAFFSVERLRQLVKQNEYNVEEGSEGERRLLAFLLQYANFLYRTAALTRLAPLNPVVYGKGWEGLLPASVELRGTIDYDHELPYVYRSDAIHLSLTNFQMRSHPNQRVFDVGASGRIVLNDRVEQWDDMFGKNLEPCVFNDLNELVDKAEILLNSRDLRIKYGEHLREKILAAHTVEKRVDTILDRIGWY